MTYSDIPPTEEMMQGCCDGQPIFESLEAMLVQRGLVSAVEIERSRRIQEETEERPNVTLTKLGLVTERAMAEASAACLNLQIAKPDDYPTDPICEDSISAKFAKKARIIPLAENADGLSIAMADPFDAFAVDALALRTGKNITPVVGYPEDIEAAHERIYGDNGPIEHIIENEEAQFSQDTDRDIARLRDLASEAPVVRLVNHIITKAVEVRASDIHVEPFEGRLTVRYRIDGVLEDRQAPPEHLHAAIISRLKILASLNIAETRLPQDGRIKLTVRGREIDLRISTLPTMHGESAVLRILDRTAVSLDFEALGMSDDRLGSYLDILDKPHGIVLVTGPTGSGKTTTLYTSLLHLNTGHTKILTVEDPIEYQLDGVNQTQVKSKIGLSFANLLRTLLRHDPDIIMIGEIRDQETAQIAVQAALTGHLVLSTLHTNDSVSTITRLQDMGIDDYLIASTLNGVVAQRLVRRLCLECREPFAATQELIDRLNLFELGHHQPPTLYHARGCEQCDGTGYQGRTTVLEVLVMTDELRRVVLKKTDAKELRKSAIAQGMQSVYQSGLQKVLDGMTTLDEVMRVTEGG